TAALRKQQELHHLRRSEFSNEPARIPPKFSSSYTFVPCVNVGSKIRCRVANQSIVLAELRWRPIPAFFAQTHHHTHSPKEEIKAADIEKEGQYQRTTGMNLLSFTTESMAGTRRGLRNLVSHLCKTFVCVLVLVAAPHSVQAQTTPDNLK